MKNIEHKLKKDALAFERNVDTVIHKNIMQSIKQTRSDKSATNKPNNLPFWLIPTFSTLATAALIVVSLQPMTQPKNILNLKPKYLNTQATTNHIQLNIELLPKLVENHITKEILLEQQALVHDINYIKNIISL